MLPAGTEGFAWQPPYSSSEAATSTPLQPLYAPLPMAPGFGGSAPHMYPTLLPYPPLQGSFSPGAYQAGGYAHPGMPWSGPAVGGWHPQAAYAMPVQQAAYFAQPQPGSPDARQQQQQQQWQQGHVSPPHPQNRQQARTPLQQRRQQQQQQQQQQQPQRRQQQQQQHQRRSPGGRESRPSNADAFVLIAPYSEPSCTPGDASTTGETHVTSGSNGLCSSEGSCSEGGEVPKRQLTAMIKGAPNVKSLQALLDVHGTRVDYIHICAMAAKLPKLQGAQPRGYEAPAAGKLLDQLLVLLMPRLGDCTPRELANVLWVSGCWACWCFACNAWSWVHRVMLVLFM